MTLGQRLIRAAREALAIASVPAAAETEQPARVHRSGQVLAPGFAVATLGETGPAPAKLSALDAARCFGVNQGGRLWSSER